MKILSFGEIIWDVYPDKRCIGGAPLNFAAHARRAGADSYMLSAIGEDKLGSEALKIIEGYGINTKYLSQLKNTITGQCRVTLNESGVPSYDILSDVAYDLIPLPSAGGEHFEALAFGTLALRGENNKKVIRRLLSEFSFDEIFVDLNLRKPFYSAESINIRLESATILKVSDEELPAVIYEVFGEAMENEVAIRAIARRFKNIQMIILTCGAEGSAVYNAADDSFTYAEAVKTEVVSTVGAGDSYGASFLCGYLSGESVEHCLKKASEVSAFVVSRAEAIPEY